MLQLRGCAFPVWFHTSLYKSQIIYNSLYSYSLYYLLHDFWLPWQGYGTTNRDSPIPSTSSAPNLANASLIKRFNQHSTMVLKACDTTVKTTTDSSASDPQGTVQNGKGPRAETNGDSASNCRLADDEPPDKRVKWIPIYVVNALTFGNLQPFSLEPNWHR